VEARVDLQIQAKVEVVELQNQVKQGEEEAGVAQDFLEMETRMILLEVGEVEEEAEQRMVLKQAPCLGEAWPVLELKLLYTSPLYSPLLWTVLKSLL
jgi:hypothetical protein